MKSILRAISKSPWLQLSYLAGIVLFIVGAVRLILAYTFFVPSRLLWMLGGYLLLYLISPLLYQYKAAFCLYLAGQILIVELLASQWLPMDMWAVLYVPLALQVRVVFSKKIALAWQLLFGLLTLVSMVLIFDVVSGVGRASAFIVVTALLIYYDDLNEQAEKSRQQSQDLLVKLQQAHLQLQDYIDQAAELASAREHEKMARELHDTVGQMVFSITLHTQAAGMMLKTDPERLPDQLSTIKDLTSQALSKMRLLISQWRPR